MLNYIYMSFFYLIVQRHLFWVLPKRQVSFYRNKRQMSNKRQSCPILSTLREF